MPLKHFDLQIVSRTLVQASRLPPGFPAVHTVSNLDLVLGPIPMCLVCVYAPPTRGFGAVLSAVRAALPDYLSHFFPFAGRIVRDPETNIPEVACTNDGAELVVANAAVPLAAVDFTNIDRSMGLIQIPFDAGLLMSLQLVRFACGGFSLTVGTNHLLADGRALAVLLNSFAEIVRTGGLCLEPRFDRSVFSPRSPPRHSPSLDDEFARFTPRTMINPLLAAAIQRRLYRIEAADLVALQTAASAGGRRTSRFVALCAHLWKLLARAVGESDHNCRMAWIVDGRKCVEPSEGALNLFMGNMVTYTSKEASVAELLRTPLHDVANTVRAAITGVMCRDRFQELVDWVEKNKAAYKDGGKWTEAVNLGLGSPALVISGMLTFAIDGDLGFGKPRLVSTWIRHSRLGSGSMILVPCPSGDGSWFVHGMRLWPQLVDVMENGSESLLKPVTAAGLGFVLPASTHGSRL